MVDDVGNRPIEVRCLPGKEDNYGGIVADISNTAKHVPSFVLSLRSSLDLWRSQKKKGVWLKLPLEYSLFVPPATEAGFLFHHAESTYVMLVHWLASDEPPSLPANASHKVSVGAYVLNEQQEILAVQERYGYFKDKWKVPTGVLHQGEDIWEGARREVLEETGIETEFVEVIGFWQRHNLKDISLLDKSDVFFLCVLRPLTSTITVQESELTDVKWMSLGTFKDQKYLEAKEQMRKELDAFIDHTRGGKGFRNERLLDPKCQAKFFYNNAGP